MRRNAEYSVRERTDASQLADSSPTVFLHSPDGFQLLLGAVQSQISSVSFSSLVVSFLRRESGEVVCKQLRHVDGDAVPVSKPS